MPAKLTGNALISVFAIIITSTLTILGQDSTQWSKWPVVVWSADENCGERTPSFPTDALVKCDSLIVQGSTVRSFQYNGITIAMAFRDVGDHIIGELGVSNTSQRRVLVNPAQFVVFHYKSKDSYSKSEKALILQRAFTPEYVASKIQNRIAWANALNNISANMATTTATVNTTASTGQTATSTITAPDTTAQARAASQNATRTANARQNGASVIEAGLYANTMLPDTRLSGLVYFKRSKKAKYSQAWIAIDEIIYVFEIVPAMQ